MNCSFGLSEKTKVAVPFRPIVAHRKELVLDLTILVFGIQKETVELAFGANHI